MKRYLLDTGIIGAVVDRNRAVEDQRKGVRIGTCHPVVGELFYGLEYSNNPQANRIPLIRTLERFVSWPFDRRAAEEFGRINSDLRRRGRPMQIVDMQAAAVARSLGSTKIITTDSDLEAIPGLDVDNWFDIL